MRDLIVFQDNAKIPLWDGEGTLVDNLLTAFFPSSFWNVMVAPWGERANVLFSKQLTKWAGQFSAPLLLVFFTVDANRFL